MGALQINEGVEDDEFDFMDSDSTPARQVTESKQPRKLKQSIKLLASGWRCKLRWYILAISGLLLMVCRWAFACVAIMMLVKWITAPQRIEFDIRGRSVFVTVPDACGRGAVNCSGAVIFLHESGGAASDYFESGFESLIIARNYYAVLPEMAVPRSEVWGYDKDLDFFAEVRVVLLRSLGIDELFICGYSAGGTMSLFLQNEMDIFHKAGVISAGVGHLHLWDMSKVGVSTMLVWNSGDLQGYGGLGYLNLTLATLQKCRLRSASLKSIPCNIFYLGTAEPWQNMPFCMAGNTAVSPKWHRSGPFSEAELLIFSEEPFVQVLLWGDSAHGNHGIPEFSNLNAARELMIFFNGDAT